MSEILNYLSSWTPTSTPTSTTLSSIATSHVSKLSQTVASVISQATTETDWYNYGHCHKHIVVLKLH